MIEKKKHGFAAIPRERLLEICAKAGRRANEKNRAYKWTSETAKKAGKKGGKAVSRNKYHMKVIGRKGGLVTNERRRAAKAALAPIGQHEQTNI